MNINFISVVLLSILALSYGDDYYELLGVKRDADQKEIRKAFKKLAVTRHPDKNTDDPKAHENFVKLTTAYEVLKDPDLRKRYDKFGEEGLNPSDKRSSYHSWNYYQNNFGIYDDDPQIVTFNGNDYFESVVDSEKMWLVNFYSPMCSHCHHLAPIWRKVAKDLEGVIGVGAVNCEDDWQLCKQVGIMSYPTILHYPKNSKHGIRYTGEKSQEAITRFVLDRIDAKIREISKSVLNLLLNGDENIQEPTLIFVCGGNNRHCFPSDERVKVAAIFDKMVNVRMFTCEEDKCGSLSQDTVAVYLPAQNTDSWLPVFLDDVDDVDTLVRKILEQLPEPTEMSEKEFKNLRSSLAKNSQTGWLVCFYAGQATELDLQLKRLPGILRDVKVGKINCGRYASLCSDLNINRYPMWGVVKPGGAFELSHGKNTINDVAKFAENSVKAKNVWALSAEKILAILRRETGNEAWFVDWYAPWCPPCMQFLPEVRKASLEFDSSVVFFGTVDCTVHTDICRKYNIRSYPTAMLINGTSTHQFTAQKTAANIVQFINEVRNPSVIRLDSSNFKQKLGKKKAKILWVVDYFAPWCGPCQQLAPEWTKVAKALSDLPFVKVANVDCETEHSLCASQGVRSYPTIRLYPMGSEGLGTVAMYSGKRDSVSLLTWVAEFLPTKVRDLDPVSFEKKVLKSKDFWVIDFFAPWCDHCRVLDPQLSIAAQLLKGDVQFGRLNCDSYRQECARADVRGYPTLMIYKKRSRHISEGIRIEGRSAQLIVNEIRSFLDKYSKHHDEL